MLMLVLIGTLFILWLWSRGNRKKNEPPVLSGSKILIGHALQYAGNSEKLWNTLSKFIKETLERGGVSKTTVGPRTIYLLSDPEDCLKASNACLRKDVMYDFCKNWVGDGLMTSKPSLWKVHRKLLNPAFSQYVLDSFMDVFNSQSRCLVQDVETKIGNGPFDLFEYIKTNALETICLTALGVDFKEKSKENKEFVKVSGQMFNTVVTRFQKFWLHNNLFFNHSSLKKKQENYIKILHRMSNNILKQKKDNLINNLSNGHSEEDNSKASLWKVHRKLLNPAFSQYVLDSFMDVFNSQSRCLVQDVETKIGNGPFDLFEYIKTNALETICLTALGVDFKEKSKENKEFVKVSGQMFNTVVTRFQKFWLHNNLFFNHSSLKKKQENYIKILHRMSNNILKQKKDNLINNLSNGHSEEDNSKGARFKPFMELLLELSRETDVITDLVIREQVDTFIVAGHDTSATALMFCMLMVGSYPQVQEKIYEELKNIFCGEDRDVTKKDLSQLVYLEAVIKESIRIYPVAPVVGRYIEEDIQLSNYTLYKGNSLYLCIHGVNHHSMWGSDVEEFRPERWLDASTLPDSPNHFVSFSFGRRNCIGKTYAMMSMKIILAHFFRSYILHGDHTKMKLKMDVLLKPVSGHHISIEKRNSSSLA